MSLDKWDRENQRELVFRVLLVGEGKSDASFLMRLMAQRAITDVHFGFPTEATGGTGINGIGKYLSSLPARTGFGNLKAIIVFYDNDSDPAAALNTVRGLIDAADPYYSTPATALTLAPEDGKKVRLLFAPTPTDGLQGALETLLLQSVPATDATLACVDAFATCSGVLPWAASHQAKMRLRSLIAAKCQGNSNLTLTHIWGDANNPIDLTHACFDGIEQTVRGVIAAL